MDPVFTGKEEQVAVIIEPTPVHYEVEVRVSHTISRRVCATGIYFFVGFTIVFGIVGFVAYAIISRGHS
jgi:cytochrome c biogenesis protein CcdA